MARGRLNREIHLHSRVDAPGTSPEGAFAGARGAAARGWGASPLLQDPHPTYNISKGTHQHERGPRDSSSGPQWKDTLNITRCPGLAPTHL